MRLAEFITIRIEQIISEWETFARTLLPSSSTMTRLELRDHSKLILLAIAEDLKHTQTEDDRALKSKGMMASTASEQTAAAIHGALRHASGFTLLQLSAEFRAMRAGVLRLWMNKALPTDDSALDDIMRFNEAMDQALAESIERYSQRVTQSRDIFLGILGHDLRTPLAAIATAADLLLVPGMPEQKRASVLATIERSAGLMAGMIDELLEYTKTSLGNGMPVNRAPADIGAICGEAVEQVRLSSPGRQLTLDLAGEIGLAVDAPRLQQVLWNLLNNALQHGAPALPVTLTARADADAVALQVHNHGSIIPTEALQTIFEPMVRLQPEEGGPPPPLAKNLGLGLYIANQIVLAHGGTLTVRSDAAHGTTFTVRLPRTVPPVASTSP